MSSASEGGEGFRFREFEVDGTVLATFWSNSWKSDERRSCSFATDIGARYASMVGCGLGGGAGFGLALALALAFPAFLPENS